MTDVGKHSDSGTAHGHRMDSAVPRSVLLSDDAEKYRKITIENSHR